VIAARPLNEGSELVSTSLDGAVGILVTKAKVFSVAETQPAAFFTLTPTFPIVPPTVWVTSKRFTVRTFPVVEPIMLTLLPVAVGTVHTYEVPGVVTAGVVKVNTLSLPTYLHKVASEGTIVPAVAGKDNIFTVIGVRELSNPVDPNF
jgi:hypothetical protein